MHEHVVAAVVRLNKAKTLCRVEPLDCSGSHLTSPRLRECASARTTIRASVKSDFNDVLGRGAGSARSTSKSIIRMAGMYAAHGEIASETCRICQNANKTSRAGSIQPAGLLLVT